MNSTKRNYSFIPFILALLVGSTGLIACTKRPVLEGVGESSQQGHENQGSQSRRNVLIRDTALLDLNLFDPASIENREVVSAYCVTKGFEGGLLYRTFGFSDDLTRQTARILCLGKTAGTALDLVKTANTMPDSGDIYIGDRNATWTCNYSFGAQFLFGLYVGAPSGLGSLERRYICLEMSGSIAMKLNVSTFSNFATNAQAWLMAQENANTVCQSAHSVPGIFMPTSDKAGSAVCIKGSSARFDVDVAEGWCSYTHMWSIGQGRYCESSNGGKKTLIKLQGETWYANPVYGTSPLMVFPALFSNEKPWDVKATIRNDSCGLVTFEGANVKVARRKVVTGTCAQPLRCKASLHIARPGGREVEIDVHYVFQEDHCRREAGLPAWAKGGPSEGGGFGPGPG